MTRRETPLGAYVEGATIDAGPPRLTVGELNRRASERLEGDKGLQNVWVEGEVLEARVWTSGHLYFTLADAEAQVRCVMWSSAVAKLDAPPKPGDRVLVKGNVSLYARRGEYQLSAREIRPVGLGQAAQALDALRRRLQAEGLFAEERKRALPRFPRGIGVVTSLKGAVLHDVLDVTGRRNPAVPILVAGVRVQGEGAAEQIEAAILRLGADDRVDVLVVARGGGSSDDLAAFNEERVVRAVAASKVPVVSAVGHETDVTLTDFAADARAPTPSAAAELVVPSRDELSRRVDDAEERLALVLARRAEAVRARVDGAAARLASAARLATSDARERLAAAAAGLEGVSPLGTLARGYAVVTKRGRVVAKAREVAAGDAIRIRFQDGETDAEIK